MICFVSWLVLHYGRFFIRYFLQYSSFCIMVDFETRQFLNSGCFLDCCSFCIAVVFLHCGSLCIQVDLPVGIFTSRQPLHYSEFSSPSSCIMVAFASSKFCSITDIMMQNVLVVWSGVSKLDKTINAYVLSSLEYCAPCECRRRSRRRSAERLRDGELRCLGHRKRLVPCVCSIRSITKWTTHVRL